MNPRHGAGAGRGGGDGLVHRDPATARAPVVPSGLPAEVIPGDCLDVLRGMADESIDAIVTDPPYELGFMGKAWDATGIAYLSLIHI